MQMLVTAILMSIPQLLNVLLLLFFYYLIFGAITLEVFGRGALQGRCGAPDFTNATSVLAGNGKSVLQVR